MLAGVVASLMAGGVGLTLALRSTGSPSPGPTAAVGPGAGPAGATAMAGTGAADAGSAAAGSGSAAAAAAPAPQTVQPVQTLPPTHPPPPAPLRTPSGSPAPTGTVMVTESTSSPVAVQRGQEVDVELSPSSQAWSEPQSGNQSILTRVSGSTGSDGSAHALFRAVADGSASVSSVQAPPACYPRCLPPQRAFDVTVSVSG